MSETFRTLIFLCVCFCLNDGSFAQDIEAASHAVNVIVDFDSAQLQTYLEKPEYQYQRRSPESSWISRTWQSVVRYFRNLFAEGSGFTDRLIAIILITGTIVALAYFFLRAQFSGLFHKKDRRQQPVMRILDQDIPVSAISDRIASARAAGDYRSAYRWTYIDLLRQLDESGVIRIVGHKTNSDYLHEIEARPWKTDFARLADAFDFIWYGGYPVNENMFDRYQNIAKQLIRQMSPS